MEEVERVEDEEEERVDEKEDERVEGNVDETDPAAAAESQSRLPSALPVECVGRGVQQTADELHQGFAM